MVLRKAVNSSINLIGHTPDIVHLIDDDSLIHFDMSFNQNWKRALNLFYENHFLAMSFNFGTSNIFKLFPFVSHSFPLLPIKHKMMWIRGVFLESIVNRKGFGKLEIGEDVAINAECFKINPLKCALVYGFGSFLHLGGEQHVVSDARLYESELHDGGYMKLMSDKDVDVSYREKFSHSQEYGYTPMRWEKDQNPLSDFYVGKNHLCYVYNCLSQQAITDIFFSRLDDEIKQKCRSKNMNPKIVEFEFLSEFYYAYQNWNNSDFVCDEIKP